MRQHQIDVNLITTDIKILTHNLKVVYCGLCIVNGKELINKMKRNGWILDGINGSHHIRVRDGKRSIPVPVHGKKDLPKGLALKILKQAEIKE